MEFLQLTKIYLIRHGSVENPDDISYGRLPVPLSETGRQQVKKLCQTLKPDFLTVPVFAYFARLGDLNLGH